jgi:hypothetical protein
MNISRRIIKSNKNKVNGAIVFILWYKLDLLSERILPNFLPVFLRIVYWLKAAKTNRTKNTIILYKLSSSKMNGDMLGNEESVTTMATIKANSGMICVLSVIIDKSDFKLRS